MASSIPASIAPTGIETWRRDPPGLHQRQPQSHLLELKLNPISPGSMYKPASIAPTGIETSVGWGFRRG